MSTTIKIYLAGPSVFRPDWQHAADEMKAICASRGVEGLYPMDAQIGDQPSPYATGLAIFDANRSLIDEADAVVADLTPFRGPSADPGTVWELAYAFGCGKIVGGFSRDARQYGTRVPQSAPHVDEHGLAVENFDMADNLMIVGCLERAGGRVLPSFTAALDRVLEYLVANTTQAM